MTQNNGADMTFLEERERLRPADEEHIPVGEIRVLDEREIHDALGRTYVRRNVKVGDESSPELRKKFFDRAEHYERMLLNNPQWETTHLDNDGQLVVDPNNIPAVDTYYQDGLPTQITEWGRQMKQAVALEPMQRLGRGGRYLESRRLDARSLELFTNMPDGIGLRSRQRIYANVLVEQALNTFDDEIHIISLGSGASVPNIQAAQEIAAISDAKINWQLFDIDQNALKSAEALITDAHLTNSSFDYGPKNKDTTTNREFPYEGRSYIEARHQADESVDVVDALGLWEYLTENQAITFLKMMYSKLKPGGVMVVSNMSKDRPHPEYNQRAIGWPDLYMRREEDMVNIVDAALIDTQNVTFTHAEDGVYMVMEVRKP